MSYFAEIPGFATFLRTYSEGDLESALLDHLQTFLLELGTGFCFEARQKRITIGNEHDYIDLVFYHRFLRCHVLLDLKIRPFSHGDAGQIEFLPQYFKQKMMATDDNPPVGVILCSDKNQTKVQFATAGLDNRLFVSRYRVALPSAEELRHVSPMSICRERKQLLTKFSRGKRSGAPGADGCFQRKIGRVCIWTRHQRVSH